jgi:hypothetical protein
MTQVDVARLAATEAVLRAPIEPGLRWFMALRAIRKHPITAPLTPEQRERLLSDAFKSVLRTDVLPT